MGHWVYYGPMSRMDRNQRETRKCNGMPEGMPHCAGERVDPGVDKGS